MTSSEGNESLREIDFMNDRMGSCLKIKGKLGMGLETIKLIMVTM